MRNSALLTSQGLANRPKILLAIVVGAALAIRLAILLIYPSLSFLQRLVEGTDAAGYMQLAQNILQNQAFHFDRSGPTAYRIPGYPLFLVPTYAFWQNPLLAQVIQILADGLTVLLTYQIGKLLSRSPLIPLLAVAITAFNPLLAITAIAIRPETLTITLGALAIWLLLKYPDSLRAGLLVAMALAATVYLKHSMTAVALVFLLAFGLRYLLNHEPTSRIAAVTPLLVVIISLAPWVVRNAMVMEAFIPLTTSNGSNLYGGNNPQANGGYVSAEPYVLPNISEVESDRIFTQRAIDWIRANPSAFLALLPAKAARLIWPLAFGTSRSIEVPRIIFAGLLIIVLAFYTFVLYGAGQLAATGQWWALFLLATIPVALLLFSLLTFGAARFWLPAFPALAVLASIAVEAAARHWRSRRLAT